MKEPDTPPITQPYGAWTEEFAREVSASGVPDFVFRPVVVAKGAKATREIGDHLILLGHQLVIVSVKARDKSRMGMDPEDKAARWLDKTIAQGAAQVDGVRRALRGAHGLELVSERGVTVPWAPADVTETLGLVLVNYTAPDNYVAKVTAATPTLVMLLSQWMELHRVMGSTAGVVRLLSWRLKQGLRVPLADELDIIGAALERDLSGDQGNMHLDVRDGWERLLTRHATLPFGAHPDHRYAAVVNSIISRAHDHDPALGAALPPRHYLEIIEALDRLARDDKVEFGKKLMEKAWLAHRENRDRYFAIADESGGLLVAVAAPGPRDERVRFLQSLAGLLHSQSVESGQNSAKRTIGIATEAYPLSGGSHDFVLIKGDLPLTEAGRQRRDELLADLTSAPRPVDPAILAELDAALDGDEGNA